MADKKTNALSAIANSVKKATSIAKAVSNAVKNSSSGGTSTGESKKSTSPSWYKTGVIQVGTEAKGESKANPYPEGTGTRGTPTDYGTYQDDLKKYTEAQRKAQIAELKAARTNALASLDAQEQNIKPAYQTARNQTSASSQLNAKNFAEYLQNRGLANSGAAAQAEINRQSGLLNNLGNINTAEANAYRDIANQRTAVENNYINGLANANNALTTNYYNNLMNYNNQQRQYIQQLQNQALGQYANDYSAYRNNLLAQGYDPNSLEVLSVDAARGNKVNALYNAGLANAANNVANGYINYNNAAALGMTPDQATNYYNNLEQQKRAVAEQEAEQQQYEREQAAAKIQRELDQQNYKNALDYNNYLLNAQKVANDTAMTKYNTNKPYYKPSSGGSKTLNDYLDELAEAGKIDFETYSKLYQ